MNDIKSKVASKVGEKQWAVSVVARLKEQLATVEPTLKAFANRRLPYTNEIRSYAGDVGELIREMKEYETDILIIEEQEGKWKPRLIIETKLVKISSHDAITYSQKAATHKQVHPYLRYGIFLGARGKHPLPGRLFRHGAHFDFMLSWERAIPTKTELARFVQLVRDEVDASRQMEEIVYETRNRSRKRYTLLHRRLILS